MTIDVALKRLVWERARSCMARVLPLILMLVGGVGCLFKAFEDDTLTGILYLFVPFYSIYFVVTNFDACASRFCIWLAGLITFGLTSAIVAGFS
jgi:hypothetical protein